MGLRYETLSIQYWLIRSDDVRESTSYQAILEEGEARGARINIRVVGEKRFGPPTEEQRSRLAGIQDSERLNRILQSIIYVASWEELLNIA